jgi:hypothetical protein
MLNPRAIAMQGLGRTSRLVAVQGLWPAPAFGGGGYGRFRVPDDLIDAQRRMQMGADELLLLIAGAVATGMLH